MMQEYTATHYGEEGFVRQQDRERLTSAEGIISTVRKRLDFGKIPVILDIPNLIEVQQTSYERFLQLNVPPDERENIGLQEIFQSVFPISDYNDIALLEFVNYSFGKPKYSATECRERGMTYSIPLKVTVRLVTWDIDVDTNSKSIRDIKEQDIYFGEIPMMTTKGTFIINGTERTVVSQMHRSPGVFFDHDKGKGHFSGKILYSCRVIPYRGSWLEFEFDYRDYLYVRIDKKRKLLVSLFLRALQCAVEEERRLAEETGETTKSFPDLSSTESILRCFYDTVTFQFDEVDRVRRDTCSVQLQIDLHASSPDALSEFLRSYVAKQDVIAPDGTVIIKEGKKITKKVLRLSHLHNIPTLQVESSALIGSVSARDVIDPETGEVLIECNEEITADNLNQLYLANVSTLDVLLVDKSVGGDALSNTFMKDGVRAKTDALLEIYRTLRPGDPPTEESASKLFLNLFFTEERYDLSKVGRLKINEKLRLEKSVDQRILDVQDLLAITAYMLKLRMGEGEIDDIDHLGNRRVRSVGELLENQFRMGLVRVERATKERMSLQELDTVMPHDLINAKPVMSAVKEFFGSSQLSQFMDQTNPLSELTHKRRMSALGPGGLSRERAGFEMRDVHSTHYGRICPIETPEGPNIGLIASLSTYGSINAYGFIETPYRKVENGRVTDTIEYLSAFKDEQYIIAQANAPLDADGHFLNDRISARWGGDFVMVPPEQIHYMDVSPKQLVSVSASLIPFLEHDDANRALMGSNMQRQGVPLVQPEAPLVGTGMEAIAARDSGSVIIAKRAGMIESVDSRSIVIRVDESENPEEDRQKMQQYAAFRLPSFEDEEDEESAMIDRYELMKFQRSNQNTCVNQRPLVKIGDRVAAGQVIADGFSTEKGELALGRNVLVAFMPWGGYNFEDAILMSERVVKEDMFTSIHIEECEIEARDTKLGREEITRDIPNVGEDALSNLDESGIVRIGAEVRPGDILVGKISPKGETHLAPEEKLLRAIFGEKAGDVKDASLRTPQGVSGIVIDVKVFSRKGVEKDERAQSIEDAEIAKIERDYQDEIQIVRDELKKKMIHLLKGKTVARDYYPDDFAKKSPASSYDDDFDESFDDEDSFEETRPSSPKQQPIFKKGDLLTPEKMAEMSVDDLGKIKIQEIQDVRDDIESLQENAMDQIHILETIMNEKTNKLRTGDELPPGVVKLVKVYIAMKRRLSVGDKMAGRHGNKGVVSNIAPVEDMPFLPDGTAVDIVLNPLGVPSRMNVGQILETCLGWASKKFMQKLHQHIYWMETPLRQLSMNDKELVALVNSLKTSPQQDVSEAAFRDAVTERLRALLSEIYDGIRQDDTVTRYLKDGNAEGLLHLAHAIKDDVYFATPVFDGASEKSVKQKLQAAGLNPSGKSRLYDGKTGEPFEQDTTVGYIYMVKLSHLVDDKMHARSIGPYSLVTQQPLGGKAQFGGQRFGEMEVWALEAYGAAYNLQELLTVKSDDVVGRTKIYESIVKGQHTLEAGIPESFNVLVKELQSLGLDMELKQQQQ
ncbi:DNA-directed RNA polymerase subunit beta [Candidatus Moduliflexus flocculans]|uniref:DNA-directed RNA polymerase subunit beta n=1 Tax=Candidatus Moduliflexus flocculans TaxID=1499966 RepID=A0A081BSD6_9BACT|nr:DNA-directed RNA polymerase subunit beta [Candidatus Moduliflexus flocculans]